MGGVQHVLWVLSSMTPIALILFKRHELHQCNELSEIWKVGVCWTTTKELWSNTIRHHGTKRAKFYFEVQCLNVVRNTFDSASLVERLKCIVRPKRAEQKEELQLSLTKSLQKQLCRFLRKFSAPQSSPQSALYVHPHHTLTHRPQSGAPIALTFSSDTKGFFSFNHLIELYMLFSGRSVFL